MTQNKHYQAAGLWLRREAVRMLKKQAKKQKTSVSALVRVLLDRSLERKQ